MMPNDAMVCARGRFFLHLLLSEAFKGTRASSQQGYVLFDLRGCFKYEKELITSFIGKISHMKIYDFLLPVGKHSLTS